MSDQTFWDIVKALITAAAGFAGVWYGQRNLARKDAKQAAQEAKNVAQEIAFIASVVIEHLERYIDGCVAVAYDDGTDCGQPAGGNGYHETTTQPPEFDPHKLDVRWQSLPPDLIYDIFAMRTRQEHIQGILGNPGFDDPPDFSEYFWTRRILFAKLGQQVTEIALRLRKAGGLPNEILANGDWSRDARFVEVVKMSEAYQARRERLHRESAARLLPEGQ